MGKTKFKIGQIVHFRHRKFWNIGKRTQEIPADVKFIVIDSRENIFDSKKTVYDIVNESIGTLSVDEWDIDCDQ